MVNSVVNSVMRKPFTCPVCGTGFTRQDNLRAHMKRHAADGDLEGMIIDSFSGSINLARMALCKLIMSK